MENYFLMGLAKFIRNVSLRPRNENQWGNGGTDPRIPNIVTRPKSVVIFKPHPLYCKETTPSDHLIGISIFVAFI
jgi:hypothetical protein